MQFKNRMFVSGLLEKMKHEQNLEENWGIGPKSLGGGGRRGEHDMQHQGLKMEVCLICLKICKEACVVEAE